jgi:DNA-directed RNA polymerase
LSFASLQNYLRINYSPKRRFLCWLPGVTPAGVKIKYQQIKIDSIVTKNSKPITISIPTNKIHKIKMIRSFMPNFIHSLDASIVHLLL